MVTKTTSYLSELMCDACFVIFHLFQLVLEAVVQISHENHHPLVELSETVVKGIRAPMRDLPLFLVSPHLLDVTHPLLDRWHLCLDYLQPCEATM